MKWLIYIPVLLLLLTSCKKDKGEEEEVIYKTEHVIIIVVDGSRYSDTWEYPGILNIPFQSALKSQGVFYPNFSNKGVTRTVSGHTAITTGVYQTMNNNGAEYPFMPSIFQRWLKATDKPQQAAWVIASKDKLAVLGNCTKTDWQNTYLPKVNCGVGGQGVGSGYRDDSITKGTAISILDYHHPSLVLINFRDPDYSAHTGDWTAYMNGISTTDGYIQEIWDFIESDPYYQGKTSLFITNDHGRHLDGVQDGFVGHGDNCQGCEHIGLLAVGPDFNSDVEIFTEHEMRDISVTIAQMMKFPLGNPEGKVLTGIFNK